MEGSYCPFHLTHINLLQGWIILPKLLSQLASMSQQIFQNCLFLSIEIRDICKAADISISWGLRYKKVDAFYLDFKCVLKLLMDSTQQLHSQVSQVFHRSPRGKRRGNTEQFLKVDFHCSNKKFCILRDFVK